MASRKSRYALVPFRLAMIHAYNRKIFVGGLSYSTTDGTGLINQQCWELSCVCADKLREFFSRFGEVRDAVVMRDQSSKRSRGFGFVVFSDPNGVDRVLCEAEVQLDGRKVCAACIRPRLFPTRA